MTVLPLGTRCVLRNIDPGDEHVCPGCNMRLKFQARNKMRKIVANIYKGKGWDRVEQWHEECYMEAASPYGEPLDFKQSRAGFSTPKPVPAS